MRLLLLLARHQRATIVSWTVLLLAVTAGTTSAYQSTYRTEAARRAAAALARDDPATTLLYGRLPEPGDPFQMYTWEIGAFVTILAGVLAVLLATALSRAGEDDGTLELVRATGIAPGAPLRAGLALLGCLAAVLGTGCAVAVGVSVGRVDAVTWSGSVAFGAVVGATFLVVGLLTFVLAQIAPTAGSARLLGFATLGLAFGLRACADTQHVAWLHWASPLALRATVRPADGPRWWALAPYAVVCLTLAVVALALDRRRDFGAGLVRPRPASDARLRIRAPWGLAARLSRGPLLAWTLAVASFGALFAAMGSGVVQLADRGELDGGFLGAQLDGTDPVASYFAYSGTVLGIVVCVFAVLTTLRARRAEEESLTDHVLATGARHWSPLAAQAAVAALGALVVLVAAGAVSAVVAPLAVDGDHVATRAFWYAVGQWPAACAVVGLAALAVAALPRATALAWVPVVGSAALALLGSLLGVPRAVRDAGVLQHAGDPVGSHLLPAAQLLLLATACVGILAALVVVNRRDVAP